MKSYNDLIAEHRNARVPKLSNSGFVGSICLFSLDSYTCGCIHTFDKKRDLDPWRLSVLGLCYGELSTVVHHLRGKEFEYFERLRVLSKLILRKISEDKEAQYK